MAIEQLRTATAYIDDRDEDGVETLRQTLLRTERTLDLRTRQLIHARREMLDRLALACEYRDDQTGCHTRRVGHLSGAIAFAIGEGSEWAEAISLAAMLHDVGKIGIPDSILLKPGPLTPDERTIMERHTTIGASILARYEEPLMRLAHEIALTHHERWDGLGYPGRLSGTAIPLSGRIVAVADAFDAMTAERPYKRPMPKAEAIGEILRCAGKQFDPRVTRAFIAVVENEGEFRYEVAVTFASSQSTFEFEESLL